jgi:hypothetical protein
VLDPTPRIGKIGASLLVLGVATLGLGCPAFNQQNQDIDSTPITDVGTGASILYPGQSPPVYQGAQHPRQTGRGSYGAPPAQGSSVQPGAAAPGSGAPAASPGGSEQRSVSGAPPPGRGSGITLIGGVTTEREYHKSVDEKPAWFKYVTLPFAIVAAPFKYAVDAVTPEREAGPAVPGLENGPAPPPPQPASGDSPARGNDYESRAIEQLERELEGREPTSSASTTGATPDDSFAAELARLRGGTAGPPQASAAQNAGYASAPPQQVAAAPAAVAAPPPPPRGSAVQASTAPPLDPSLATASGHVDRDGDGRTDQWIFRERGEIVREVFDEDFDGRTDRTLHYDLETHQIDAIEEDADSDGRLDTWITLREGSIVRRRRDTDGDGHVDSWSFFQNGLIARLERDTTGDGFRDRVTRYEAGQLAREEIDGNADGRVETIRHYDANKNVSRLEEDTDRDGQIDLITHYQDGRLHRREILDASALAPVPILSEHN